MPEATEAGAVPVAREGGGRKTWPRNNPKEGRMFGSFACSPKEKGASRKIKISGKKKKSTHRSVKSLVGGNALGKGMTRGDGGRQK